MCGGYPDCFHGFLEQASVFGGTYGFETGPDEFNVVLFENVSLRKFHRHVESRLTAECREQCVGTFLCNDRFNDLGGDRLDVGGIRKFWVGHDGCGVRVD